PVSQMILGWRRLTYVCLFAGHLMTPPPALSRPSVASNAPVFFLSPTRSSGADVSDPGVPGDGRHSTGYLWPQNASVGSACVDSGALMAFEAVAGNAGGDCPPVRALTPEAGVSQPPKTSEAAGIEGALVERGIHRRLEQDVRGLQDMVGRSSIEVAARTEISKRLDKLAGQVANVGWSPEN